jgi:LysM repeat protein
MLKSVRMSRIPEGCPPGFPDRYVVKSGDTMFFIAQRFGVPLEDLIGANPHIVNPNLIFPGDVLCVPSRLTFPCCVVLEPSNALKRLSPDALGSALTRLISNGQQHSVSILAVSMPPPSDFGNFDIYFGFVGIPGIGGFGFQLFPTPEQGTWAGTLEIKLLLNLATTVDVLPASFNQGTEGPILLQGALNQCGASSSSSGLNSCPVAKINTD